MMRRFLLSSALLVIGCGTSQTNANVSFACGDAGLTCQSATQYCDIVTTTGGVPKDSGPSSYVVASCAPLPAGCTTCDCLFDAGALGGCLGSVKCAPGNDDAITANATCLQ